MTPSTRALAAEVVGTFFFFTIGASAILADASGGNIGLIGIALAHGLALAIAVSIFGPISGGHFNPAVSLGLAIGRAFPWTKVIPYWIAQLVGGLAAGVLLRIIFSDKAVTATHNGTPFVATGVAEPTAALVEAVITFLLVLAVFGTAVSPTAPRIAGFGIGLALLGDILAAGPLTGAAANPARYFGTGIPVGFFAGAWVYVVGPLVGGLVAGVLWRYLFATSTEAVSTQR